jgi:uncharacterized membrane protein
MVPAVGEAADVGVIATELTDPYVDATLTETVAEAVLPGSALLVAVIVAVP